MCPILTLYHTIPTFNDPAKTACRKHCGKRRKCWIPAFSPFPAMFSTHPQKNFCFESHLFCHMQMLLIWTSLKFCCLVKELNYEQMPIIWLYKQEERFKSQPLGYKQRIFYD